MKMCRSECALFIAVALCIFGLWLSPATAQLLGPEFQVNSYTTGSQYEPAVATDGSGNFVVVWNRPDGSNFGVFGQRYDSAGNPQGSEFPVNTFTANMQKMPAVAADGSGNFVVVWESNFQDGSYYGVFGQRFNSSGSPVGSEFQVNSYATGSQYGTAVAMDGSGSFVVVWGGPGQDGSLDGVFGQRYDSAGSPVGSEFQVNTYTTSYQKYPAVAAAGSGNFVVAWQSHGQDGSLWGVFGQRFNSAGSPVGTEFQVNSHTADRQLGPAMATDSSGNFVVAWTSFGQDGSNRSVFGQRFNSAGSRVGSEFRVNTYTTGSQENPAVATDGPGNFVVVWNSLYQDGSSSGVFGQRFNAAGNSVGSEFQVNAYTTSAQRSPAVAADVSHDFVVVWNSDGQDGSNYGVFGRRLTASVFQHGFERIPPFWSATTATMCTLHCGGTPDGICWCDAACLTAGDCCLDACITCGQCVP